MLQLCGVGSRGGLTGLGRERSQTAVQTALDQENWNFIPPIDELLNAGCPRKGCDLRQNISLLLTQKLTADHSSDCTHSTMKSLFWLLHNWAAIPYELTKYLNPMFKSKDQTKSVHLCVHNGNYLKNMFNDIFVQFDL